MNWEVLIFALKTIILLSLISHFQSKHIIKDGCLQKNLYTSFVKQILFHLTSYLFAVIDEHETGAIIRRFDQENSFTIHKLWRSDWIFVHSIESNIFVVYLVHPEWRKTWFEKWRYLDALPPPHPQPDITSFSDCIFFPTQWNKCFVVVILFTRGKILISSNL